MAGSPPFYGDLIVWGSHASSFPAPRSIIGSRNKTDSSVIDALLWAARLSSFERTGSVGEELFFESSGGAFSK